MHINSNSKNHRSNWWFDGKKILIKLQVSITSPQNSLETVETETVILKERYISPVKRKKTIDNLRLV